MARTAPAAAPDADAPDEALLVLYANGDPGAARELSMRLVPRTLGYAARLLGGDRAEAEDVAQEAMIRLFRAAPEWQAGGARVTSWLYRVVANLCLDRLRRRPMLALDAVPEAEDGQPGVEAYKQNMTAILEGK